ncbi:unnamed protein product [Aphanomyces euteiches]|uniref:F-box domain-containing protein n=1 Tax=Aphanomyces euteiches TaxID=100861 RepID=A0A6G0X1M7_9STRA|nr:hypothetical protein Ae201684_009323 [Aphanomyces euteiches]KAH9070322.1 hypothetical protein Ae201684P_002684 [Aphanomyces euteiches]KAH9141910.1 hypothetical protein AeRB84_013983 [Aphanomyces euteiches]
MKRPRRVAASITSIPAEIIQHIALFIPDTKGFFSFLASFQDAKRSEALGELSHFLKLAKILEGADLWPKLQLRLLRPLLIPTLRCVTRFFTTIYVLHVHNAGLIKRCLHDHNVVELLDSPSHSYLDQWLTESVSMLPVQHITFNSPSERSTALLVDQLDKMPHLVSLNLRRTNILLRDFDRLLAFIQARSTFSRLCLSTLHVPTQIQRRPNWIRGVEPLHRPPRLYRHQLDLLKEWLSRSRATSIKLRRWHVDDDGVASGVKLLHAIFASSTLESASLTTASLGPLIAMTKLRVPLRMQLLDLSDNLIDDTAMMSLAKGLRDSNIKSLNLGENNIGHCGMSALLDVLPTTKMQKLRLRCMYLDDSTCQAIAAVLPSTKIADLDLSDNNLTDRTAEALATAVGRATSLTSLHLYRNVISLHGASVLVNALSRRGQVTTWLDLGANFFHSNDKKYLHDMVHKSAQILKANFE